MSRICKQTVPEMIVIQILAFAANTPLMVTAASRVITALINDATLINLGKQAVVVAAAGADFIAPSSVMDGQVQVIRQALDAAGFIDTAIISYSTKFASSFYSPFRKAAGIALKGDERKTLSNESTKSP